MTSPLGNFIKSVCVQTAVYWAAPTPDGYGTKTYCEPVEISCRWDSKIKRITNNKGDEIVSTAQVLLTQEVEPDGMLFLGRLYDLYIQETVNPEEVTGAYVIQNVIKTPEFRSTVNFVYEVML